MRLLELVAGLAVALLAGIVPAADAEPAVARIEWRDLPPLPQALGGQVVGTSGGHVIVAGGTDFPVPLDAGGAKAWYGRIFVLGPDRAGWRDAGRLEAPLAYAAVAQVGDRFVVAGGSDGRQHLAMASIWEWTARGLQRTQLPALPQPVAMAGAAVLGGTVVVIGGQRDPGSLQAERRVWLLELARPDAGWQRAPELPGAGRILPVVVAQGGSVLVVSGAELGAGPDGRATRRYLRDGYRFDPHRGWSAVADVPAPIVAAPAIAVGQSHTIVMGGDSGRDAGRAAGDPHPGFSRTILAHHTITNTWVELDTLPIGLVTTVATGGPRGRIILAGGEVRPGQRSARVLEGTVVQTARAFTLLDNGVVIAYLASLLVVGWLCAPGNQTTDDFFLAGRRVPWWAAGLSIYGTQLSAITFLAIPAKAYAENWIFLVGNLCIVLTAPIVVRAYLPFFRGLDVTSAYEYLERRFNLAVRLLGSGTFVILQFARMAIVLFLPSLALAAVTGIDVYVSVLAMGVLCTVYTHMGGMRAVVWTDVLQVVVLLGAAVVSLVLIVGGVEGGLAGVARIGGPAGKFDAFDWTWDATVASVWVVVLGNLLANLVPYTADQSVVQRYLTTTDERQAARAVWTNALMTIPTSFLFFGVGSALFAYYASHPGLLHPAVPTDATFAWFIGQELPVGLSGLVVAGVFAAAMSTVSSSINSMATAIVTDFAGRLRPSLPDRTRLALARWLSLLIGIGGTAGALALATWNVRSLWDAFLQAVGLFGGGLAGLFALGIFSTRANGRGALAGLLGGGAVLLFVQQSTRLHFLLYGGIGLLASVTIGYVASVVLRGPAPQIDGLTVHTRGGLRRGRGSARSEVA